MVVSQSIKWHVWLPQTMMILCLKTSLFFFAWIILLVCLILFVYLYILLFKFSQNWMILDLQGMMSTISSHHCNWSPGFQEHLINRGCSKTLFAGYSGPYFPSKGFGKLVFFRGQCLARRFHQGVKKYRPVLASMVYDGMDQDDSEDENNEKESAKGENGGVRWHFFPFLLSVLYNFVSVIMLVGQNHG